MAIVGPRKMAGQHVLGSLMPLETDQRDCGQVRFVDRQQCLVEGESFGSRCRWRGSIAVLEFDAAEGIDQRDGKEVWITGLREIPSAGHSGHAQVGGA